MIERFAASAGRRPVAVTVFAILIVVIGIISWNDLSLDLFPDLQSPTILVSVSSGDRPTEQMERLYGERIEQLLFTVPGLKSIEQVVRSGKLISRVTFNWDVDIDLALVDVNRAVASIASDPEVEEVKVRRFDTRQLPVLILGLTAEADGPDLSELRRLAKRQLAPNLEQLNGIAEIRVSGGRVKEVQVQLDPTRVKAHGFTIDEIRSRISASNLDFNAGILEEGDKVLLVQGKSRFLSAEDIKEVVIRYVTTENDTVKAVKVSDVAQVITTDADIKNLIRINGKEGIGLFVYKEAGANTVSVSNTIHKAVDSISTNIPRVSVKVITDEAALVVDAISDVKSAAFMGIGLSILVLTLFLRSPGPIIIVSVAVPISLLATTFAMGLAGHSLNLMTLGGLALGAGMLVDNAIVVIESIFRRRALGDSPIEAAKKGTGLVGGAIVASTLTTCIVFLPVLFIEGMAAKLVSGISFTVVVSLLASLFVAIFLIPALSTSLLPQRNIQHIDPGSSRLEAFIYNRLSSPWRIILLTIIVVSIAIISLTKLGTELLAPEDPRQFSLRITTPPGQRLESTVINVAHVESILKEAAGNDLVAVLSEVGQLDDDERLIREQHTAENTAEIRVRLAAASSAGKVIDTANPAIKSLYGTNVDWQVSSSALTQALGKTGPAIVVTITGNSIEELRYSAEKLRQQLSQFETLWNVQTSFEGAPAEIHLKLNRRLADGLGVDLNTIRSVIEASLDGLKTTTLALGDESRDIVITLPKIRHKQILDLSFQSPTGELLTIGDVAQISLEPGAREILRSNQRRIAQVTALVSPGYSNPQARASVDEVLSEIELPPTVTAKLAGEEIERLKTMNELSWASLLALLLVLMVLAGSFESFLLPIAVLASIPMALVGVAAALVPTGQPIGVMAMLGFVVLVGIAVNDAILLVQTARNLILNGMERRKALAHAVSQRLRPIIMTTATTVLSLLPLAISTGEAAQLRSPLAWTVIGGIIASTLGCLLVIPSLYLVLDRFSIKNRILKRAHDSL